MSMKKAIYDVLLWRGLNFISVFILNILLARMLEATGAGSLFYVINNLSLCILLLSLCLESGLAFYAASNKSDSYTLSFVALGWTLLACILFAAISVVIPAHLVEMESPYGGWPGICFVAGNLLISFYSALFSAQRNFITPNLCSLIINVGLILFFLLNREPGLSTPLVYAGYFGSFLVQGLVIGILYFSRARVERSNTPQPALVMRVLRYSFVALVSNLVFFLVYRADYWFVEGYCSDLELGNYIQVSKLVQWLMLMPMLVSTAIFPITAASGNDGAMAGRIVTLSRIILYIYLGICAVLALTGYWLFEWIFGETYHYMYIIFLLHIPGILALAMLYPVSAYHAGIKRIDINLQGALAGLLVIAVLNFLFTPRYGIYSASIISSLGYICYFIFSLLKLSKRSGSRLRQFFVMDGREFVLLRTMLDRRNGNLNR